MGKGQLFTRESIYYSLYWMDGWIWIRVQKAEKDAHTHTHTRTYRSTRQMQGGQMRPVGRSSGRLFHSLTRPFFFCTLKKSCALLRIASAFFFLFISLLPLHMPSPCPPEQNRPEPRTQKAPAKLGRSNVDRPRWTVIRGIGLQSNVALG